MGWFQQPGANAMDKHNEPTEPLPDFDDLPTTPAQNNLVLPAPHPSGQPFPQQHIQIPGQPSSTQPAQAYPYLPPTVQQGPQQENGEKVRPTRSGKQKATTRSLKPLLPGLFFVALQLTLLLRFILKITGLMADQSWVGGVFSISEVFVLPFRVLWLQVPLQLPAQVELYTLLAVVVYGLISRLLVRLLKLLLNRH